MGCPIQEPSATHGQRVLEMPPVPTEMCHKCKYTLDFKHLLPNK